MISELGPLPIAAIDCSDATFRITTEESIDRLRDSIGKIGLVSPPILRPLKNGFGVVSGFRRLEACRCLGWSHVPARRVADAAGPWRCALLAVAENLGQRSLNPLETGRALRLLGHTAPDDKHLREALHILGLPDNPAAERRFSSLCELPGTIQVAVARGEVAVSTAENLGRLPRQTAEPLAALIVSLRLGLNKQREMVELLLEIARAEGRTPEAVLKEPALVEIMADTQGDRAHRAHRLRQLLRHRRFPNLSRTEARFETLRRRLALSPDADLVPPPGFEGRHYRLNLSFASRQDLARHREMLDALLEDPDLEAILALGLTS